MGSNGFFLQLSIQRASFSLANPKGPRMVLDMQTAHAIKLQRIRTVAALCQVWGYSSPFPECTSYIRIESMLLLHAHYIKIKLQCKPHVLLTRNPCITTLLHGLSTKVEIGSQIVHLKSTSSLPFSRKATLTQERKSSNMWWYATVMAWINTTSLATSVCHVKILPCS